MEYIRRLRERLMTELHEIPLESDWTPSCLERALHIIAGIKDLDTIQGMEDHQNSYNSESREKSGRYSREYRPMYSENWRPDRYSEKRYYSRDDGRSRMSAEIERLMEDAPNEEVRQALRRVMMELN